MATLANGKDRGTVLPVLHECKLVKWLASLCGTVRHRPVQKRRKITNRTKRENFEFCRVVKSGLAESFNSCDCGQHVSTDRRVTFAYHRLNGDCKYLPSSLWESVWNCLLLPAETVGCIAGCLAREVKFCFSSAPPPTWERCRWLTKIELVIRGK